MIVLAISFCAPIASIVTVAPRTSSIPSRVGIAVISFDFSSVREPRHEFHRAHDAVGASPPRGLEQVGDAPIRQQLDAREREGRARALPHEPLATLIVIRWDAHGA